MNYLFLRLLIERIAQLEFEKQLLVEFNERAIADRDELEQRLLAGMKLWLEHKDTYSCVEVGREDKVLEAEFIGE